MSEPFNSTEGPRGKLAQAKTSLACLFFSFHQAVQGDRHGEDLSVGPILLPTWAKVIAGLRNEERNLGLIYLASSRRVALHLTVVVSKRRINAPEGMTCRAGFDSGHKLAGKKPVLLAMKPDGLKEWYLLGSLTGKDSNQFLKTLTEFT